MGLAPYPWLERPAEVLSKSARQTSGRCPYLWLREDAACLNWLPACGSRSLSAPADGAPCGICEECKLIFSGNHPDLRYVLSETEAALHPEPWNGKFGEIPKGPKGLSKQILIEQVRGIGEYLSVTAHRAGHRAVVIYPADSMSGDQSSALLKRLKSRPKAQYLSWLLMTSTRFFRRSAPAASWFAARRLHVSRASLTSSPRRSEIRRESSHV